MRDKLIELLEKADRTIMGFTINGDLEILADYLLDNGVVIPPCKVGDTVWKLCHLGEITEATVNKLVLKNGRWYLLLSCNALYETSCNSIGKTVFFNYKEAEKASRNLRGDPDVD